MKNQAKRPYPNSVRVSFFTLRCVVIERFFKWANWHAVSGEWIPWAVFIREFQKYLVSRNINPIDWPQSRIEWALGQAMPVGRGPGNVKGVFNVSREFMQPRRWVRDEIGNVRLEPAYIRVAS